jgi:hypothetical protein
MLYIRQGATHKVVVGPVVAVANGYVPVTTLDLSTADEAEAILHDNGTTVSISAYTFAAITNADGYYHLTLQSGISNTVGHVTIAINDDSLCLPVRQDFTVVEEAVYDQLFAASAPGAATASLTSDIHSSLVITKSDLVVIDDLASDIHSLTTKVYSDTTRIDTSATAAASNVLLIYSDTTRIDSNTVLAETNISDIESSLVIIKSDLIVIDDLLSDVHSSLVITKSDLVVIDDLASDIHSSLVIAKSDLVLLTAPGDGTTGAYPALGIVDQGTAQSASATTLVLRSATPFSSDDACLGATLWAHGSTQGYWQARIITDYTTVDDTATVDTWDVTPSGTITYKIFGTAPDLTSAGALTATQASQLTRIQSDLIIAQSDVIIIGSDLLQVYSDTTHIDSDVTLAETNISDIESSLVIVKSDLVVIDDLASDIHSSLVIAKSDLVLLTAPGDGTAGAYPAYNITDQGTAQSATGTTIVLRSAAVFANDTPIGMTVLAFGSTQGYWQARVINDYDLATDTATVTTWTVTPSGTITYKVFGTAPVSISALTAQQSSQLTRVQSDGIVVQSQVLKVYSDTTAIHTQTTTAETNISDIESSLVIVKSDLVVHEGLISDNKSSLVIVKSDLVIITSDTTAVHSQTTKVLSDTTAVHSDTTAMHTQTTTIASDLVQVYSDTTRIDSNTVLAETNISDIESSLVIIKSDLVIIDSNVDALSIGALTSDQDSKLTRIASDVILAETNISDIESSLVIVKSDLVVAEALASDNKSSLVIVKSGLVVARSDLVISNSDTTAIQTKTDSLTFTQAGHVDANVQRVNDVVITGDGSAGDKFDVV